MNHIENLLMALQSYAPNPVAVKICATMLENARRESNDDNEIVLVLADAISDGIRYGNWPWNSHEAFVGRRDRQRGNDF